VAGKEIYGKGDNSESLKPVELVTKSQSELLQLKKYYELKIQDEHKYDIFRRPKKWIRRHKKSFIYLLVPALILMLLSFYFGMTTNNMLYSIPAWIIFASIIFITMMFESANTGTYYDNVRMIDMLLQAKSDSMKRIQPISPKAMKVFEALKSFHESGANFTVLMKKINEDKDLSVDSKTLRKFLKEDLKDLVEMKEQTFNSASRRLKKTKVYYAKNGGWLNGGNKGS